MAHKCREQKPWTMEQDVKDIITLYEYRTLQYMLSTVYNDDQKYHFCSWGEKGSWITWQVMGDSKNQQPQYGSQALGKWHGSYIHNIALRGPTV